MSAGILRNALSVYRVNDPDFVGAYFPNIAFRGRATYDDVFGLTQLQAEALVPMLEDSIRYYWRLDSRDRNRNLSLIERTPIDPGFVSLPAKRANSWTRALKDLCDLFGVPNPL